MEISPLLKEKRLPEAGKMIPDISLPHPFEVSPVTEPCIREAISRKETSFIMEFIFKKDKGLMMPRPVKTIMSLFLGMCLTAFAVAGCSLFHSTLPAVCRDHCFTDGRSSVTWIGHATFLVRTAGVNILTDPMYERYIRYGIPVAKRFREPALPFADLPRIDAVVISHEHPDHMNGRTLSLLPKSTPVIVPKGTGTPLRVMGFADVRELAWWEETRIGPVAVAAAPVKHGSLQCAGFVIRGKKVIFFAGDTVVVEGFSEIGKRFPVDLALLPIGDYRMRVNLFGLNRWLKRSQHMGPADVPAAIERLRCRKMIPMHWGTFSTQGILSIGADKPAEELRAVARERGLERRIVILDFGEQYYLER